MYVGVGGEQLAATHVAELWARGAIQASQDPEADIRNERSNLDIRNPVQL
jgi:hypothetical protein